MVRRGRRRGLTERDAPTASPASPHHERATSWAGSRAASAPRLARRIERTESRVRFVAPCRDARPHPKRLPARSALRERNQTSVRAPGRCGSATKTSAHVVSNARGRLERSNGFFLVAAVQRGRTRARISLRLRTEIERGPTLDRPGAISNGRALVEVDGGHQRRGAFRFAHPHDEPGFEVTGHRRRRARRGRGECRLRGVSVEDVGHPLGDATSSRSTMRPIQHADVVLDADNQSLDEPSARH